MSIVKSFSVGNGDMFYIKHRSDNFTVIDCNLTGDNKEEIVNEIQTESSLKDIRRFISTHPDEDHFHGLTYLDEQWPIHNFYVVKNEATKSEETIDFQKYCELRDSYSQHFYISKGCSRRWMNLNSEQRGNAGINILWPDRSNKYFIDELNKVARGQSPNNISAIIQYTFETEIKFLWMGDLETDYMENIKDELELPEISILFAPHHGRSSGKIPSDLLAKMNPKIIIIGEADSDDLDYYSNYNTITQNSAGDITFECEPNKIHIYVSNENYTVNFLDYEYANSFENYIGTLK